MEKILVIQTAFIGDAVLTLPMIQKLKEKFPASEIDVLAIPSTEEIFSTSPFVNEVIILDKRGAHKSIFSLWKFIKDLRKKNYSKVFSPHRSFRTSFIVMNLNVKETYGFTNSSLRHVYKYLIDYIPAQHEVQRNLSLIGLDPSEEWRILPEIKFPDTAKKKAADFISEFNLNTEIIAVAPGSVWNTKRYPIEYFEEVIRYFTGKSLKVILIGSEKEKSLCDSLKNKFSSSVYSAAGMFSLIETVALLKNVRMLITNDSAPTHLALCANIPVLTLYCSTVPDFGFYPYNFGSSFLSYDELSCKPCGIHGYEKCPVNTFACGYNLTPQIVISKIKEMFND